MPTLWKCPHCGRRFRQARQAHSCGVGDREALLDGKPPELVALYRDIEAMLAKLDGVEIVAVGRQSLFRTTRIFADVGFTKEALRLAVLLPTKVEDERFFKVLALSAHRVAHVMWVRDKADVRAAKKYLKEAHAFARAEDAARGKKAKSRR